MAVRIPPFVQAGSYSANDVRLLAQAMFTQTAGSPRSGVVIGSSSNSPLSVNAQGTPNMSVLVRTGQAVIAGSQQSFQGAYEATSDADATLTIAASDPTNPRIDIVVLQVEDAQYAGAANDAKLAVITGTPAGSPVAPSAPANSITLAQVRVDATVTSIVSGKITDTRVFTAAQGGIIPCTSTTHPLNPFSGMTIFETDTGNVLTWTGSAWSPDIPPGGSIQSSLAPAQTDTPNSASYTDWVSFGNITVPTWATKARLLIATNYYAINATGSAITARAVIGSAVGGNTVRLPENGLNVRETTSWTDLLTGIATGSQVLKVQAARSAGTGNYRADTNGQWSALVDFLP